MNLATNGHAALAACGFAMPASSEGMDRLIDTLGARLTAAPDSAPLRAAISALGGQMRDDLERELRESLAVYSIH